MSYEGYDQQLCAFGHYMPVDCNLTPFNYAEAKCEQPSCMAPIVWFNSVNETNGSEDPETGERIDGYVELELIEDSKVCKCQCGNTHTVGGRRYKLPPEGIGHHLIHLHMNGGPNG